jgi:hypothetical protein
MFTSTNLISETDSKVSTDTPAIRRKLGKKPSEFDLLKLASDTAALPFKAAAQEALRSISAVASTGAFEIN